MGSEMVFVLGHMEYYPKFGFIPDAKKLGFTAPHPIPVEYANAWMVQSLNPEGFVIGKGNVILKLLNALYFFLYTGFFFICKSAIINLFKLKAFSPSL